MNKLLTEKLVNEFPLLFTDYGNRSRVVAPIALGIETGDGWYQLIYNLCNKLEPAIREWMAKTNVKCRCGCPLLAHPGHLDCKVIHRAPYKLNKRFSYMVPNLKRDLELQENKPAALQAWWHDYHIAMRCKLFSFIDQYFLLLLYKYNILVKRKACGCMQYKTDHPRIVQMKEKFGELRVYMSSELPGFTELIDNAARLSRTTCEKCGSQAGILDSHNNWLRVLCEKCQKKIPLTMLD
jgi:hypothetical protein